MPAQLFLNAAQGQFIDVVGPSGTPGKSRGSAADSPSATSTTTAAPTSLIVSENDPLAVLRNQPASRKPFSHSFARGTHSNRDAVGAGSPSSLQADRKSPLDWAEAAISRRATRVSTWAG